ncbi:MAG: CHASE2 domain-containing protein [Rhodospirillaceae bacterium]
MKRRLSHILIVGTVVAGYLFGGFAPLERGLSALRFQILASDSTGRIVVVGIDSRSLRALNVWPWPREYHGQLIDRLVAAGASRIALDIDFSSYSSPQSDSAFEDALRRAGDRVILATFKQPVRDSEGRDVFAFTPPIPQFVRHGRLGHVNVQVEGDSLVWRYTPVVETNDVPLPGMATLLADVPELEGASFGIDYAIRPETLPYVSYVDVLTGNFDPGMLSGKTVIVGATALELGDRIPVPVHYVLPGPVVQALVAETILQERRLNPVAPWIVVVLALLVGGLSASVLERWSWKRGALALLGFVIAMAGVSLAVQASAPLILEVSPIVLAPLGLFLVHLVRSIDRLGSMFRRERMESLYRRAMMGAVVDSSFDGIAIADRDGNIELLNPSAVRLLGREEREMYGVPIHSILPWSAEIEAFYGTGEVGGIQAGVLGPMELSLPYDGDTLTIELIVSSARLNLSNRTAGGSREERIVYIYMFRDITERKRAEEAQKRATEEATAANRAKTEFLHNMSHELRTPLNAIIGFSDIIRNEMMGPVGVPQYLEYVGDINNSGQHLLQVVNDILDMSKIESGQVELIESEVFLPHVVEGSVRLVEERARTAGQTLEVELASGLPELRGDERMIKQMLLNLLTNAVKFTPQGGRVTVAAYTDDGGGIVMLVRDTGIGIDICDFERIMEPFGQADASLSREYEGTGLGLPLVKSMVELHQGRLALESEVGVGSVFSLIFPPERSVTMLPAGSIEAAVA